MENHTAKIYTCPMHPEVRKEHSGMCPECGMSLVLAGEKKHGHDKHKGHSTNIFKTKFWVSFVLSIPVVLYSELAEHLLNWTAPAFPGSDYLSLVLGSIIFFYGGWVFLVSAWREIKGKLPGMMTLISLAIVTAYAYSIYGIVTGTGRALFWELATLITIMLLGHWMEMRAVTGAQGALKELSKLLPDTAEVVRGEKTETVPLSEIKEKDMVLVKPGGKIPVDGTVIHGNSEVDEALVTGESKPVEKKEEDEVIAGTINGDGSLRIHVTKIGEHTFLAGVVRLVEEAQASKSRLQLLSDRAALYLTAVAIVVGTTSFGWWLAAGAGAAFAIERLVAVFVIACPHALGLAIPLVASISTTKAAQNGFLVKQRIALETARNINTVLFDKTGTLTKGEYGVVKVERGTAESESEIMRVAASINENSEHAIARAVGKKAHENSIKLLPTENFTRIPGKGVQGSQRGKNIFVGGEAMLDHTKTKIPEGMREEIQKQSSRGRTVVYVIEEGSLLGWIALADIIRDESREAIKSLREMGIQVGMITGDSEDVAKWVAEELGIDEYFAKVLPHEKTEKIKLVQEKGRHVAMVGDGINDAPALTQADLGIAIGAGTNVAIESAGIILVRNDPRDIAKIIKLSRLTYAKMTQNIFWAAGYNVLAIPLAAGVLVSQGIVVQPAIGAIFMSASTVIVALNALLLKKKEI